MYIVGNEKGIREAGDYLITFEQQKLSFDNI